jgi:hypothetical protein
MTKHFYESVRDLERLREVARPSKADLDSLTGLVSADDDLAIYFYQKNDNGAWITLLKEAGEFEGLGKAPDEVGKKEYLQAAYLAEVAEKDPESVLAMIGSIDAKDAYIKSRFLEALLKVPVDVSVRATWLVLKYLHERTVGEWYLVGEPSAKFMERLAERYENEAFAVAEELLEVWLPDDSEKSIFNDITAKFPAYEYNDLVFQYYERVARVHPFRAAKLLVRIFDRYLSELNQRKGFDVSEHFYITIENLDTIDRADRDHIAILVKAICDAAKIVIEREPEKLDGLLDCLKATRKAIFARVEMYLLRFVPNGTYKERIAEILLDKGLFDGPGFRREYDFLLRDKIDEVRDAVEGTYRKWIEGIGVEDKERFAEWFRSTREREPTQGDLDKYENRMRAERLYLVREQFPEAYAVYKEKAGSTDEQLAPTPMISTGERLSPAQDSPIPVEDMVKMEPGTALDYLRESSNYEGKRKPGMWHDPKEALTYVFGEVVRQRVLDYVTSALNGKLIELDPMFLGTYLNRIFTAVREQELGGAIWGPWLELCRSIVRRSAGRPEYERCLSDILWTIQEGLGERNRIEFNRENMEVLWSILKALVRYTQKKEGTDVDRPEQEDPIQMRCRSIAGEALAQVVSCAIACKADPKGYYEERLRGEVRSVFDYVVSDVKRAEVNCTLGSDLTRIHWLDEEWLRNNLDKIFDGEMWDAVWGTHMAWGRPWPQTFKLLMDREKYRHAIGLIGTPNRYKFGKDPEEGLAEHLMIALFNGWLDDGCKAKLLQEFLEKAPAKLRGHAARFLTTGFESLKNEPADQETADRLRQYWEMRLAAITEKSKENFEEAVAFISWAENSPIEAPVTLRLLGTTVELTGGKLGDRGYEFTKAVCSMGKGNEIAALRCLNKAMADDEAGMYFPSYGKELTEFMESIPKLADDYANVEDIRREAMLLADAYGRKHIYRFRETFEMLSKKVGGAHPTG